ncbi:MULTISPECIES: acetolactate synthase small subunit [Serratia]|jgi:acetolactate synthase-1/3 small subunit|uniref:acetolactate synthase n=1 Tax=Serratia liquefaciens TaxID=614 RepID=A0A515D0G5_SERLI|nr:MULTISPECIES: acetolactate synthase small subunit [Serratia]AYO36236.1 acetolactate synthase 1 small subunit [Serratia sp. P2ACOL2]MBI6163753.1 acetolactate synthase small subunit [Serratia liquefaciens]MBV0843152.1 acetolactate synthase small subunit [Serratia liquefaciens]MCS4319427.1 acetolactate synthase-1/3 small subunit [Serratia sp. BIGb0234]MDU5485618.1 acetolactate synthase small subunit [Serratia liquefaciens]
MSEQRNNPQVILELAVRNHPGVMSHVCGLFARRAFNVEGILCLPLKDGKQSRIWLLVADDQRLMQMISQVEKLEDVLQVKRHSEDVRVFEQLEAFFQ